MRWLRYFGEAGWAMVCLLLMVLIMIQGAGMWHDSWRDENRQAANELRRLEYMAMTSRIDKVLVEVGQMKGRLSGPWISCLDDLTAAEDELRHMDYVTRWQRQTIADLQLSLNGEFSIMGE